MAGVALSILQTISMIYLLIHPKDIIYCYIYTKKYLSITQCIIASLITSCGFITIATLNQIRVHLKVLLKEIPVTKSAKRIRKFNIVIIITFIVLTIGSLALIIQDSIKKLNFELEIYI